VRSTGELVLGLAFLVAGGIFYALADRTTGTSIAFAFLMFAGFGLIARWLVRRL
jgi:hypothetical protein